MKNKIQILHLEDSDEDSLIVKEYLSSDRLSCEIHRVESRSDFVKALETGKIDLILADCSLPQFSGLQALDLAKAVLPLTPFVFFSGTLGEETAIESLRKGATDYVLKSRPSKLALAIRRSIKEAEERALRQEMEQRLSRSQRLEAVGTLAGGIAHDFNNILTIILGHASLLRQESKSPERVLEIANTFELAARRGAEMVMQLLAFARKTEGHFSAVNLNQQIRATFTLLREAFPRNILFSTDCEEILPPILADPAQIQRVLINLATNARDAMPHGGTIHINTRLVDALEVLSLSPSPSASSYIHLTFSDSGIGMTEETRKRIFEPFFTTKPIGKGTGLGLPVVYGLMQTHHGYVDIQSELGKGTAISLYFPVLEISYQPEELTEPVPESSLAGTEIILLIEDEPDVAFFLSSVLKSNGYTIYQARNAAEAIGIFDTHSHEIDLVLSDIGLPELDGFALCEKLKKSNPQLKTVLSSGYPEANHQERMVASKIDGFVPKPYNPKDILSCIREIFDQSETP